MRMFEYRLYPNKEQSHLLMGCLIESRKLYNEMRAELVAKYEQDATFPSKYDLTAQFKGRGGKHVPASSVQMLAGRLTKALKRFLAAKELGLPNVGFPRFKKPNRWHSIQLRQYGKDVYLDASNGNSAAARRAPNGVGRLLAMWQRPISRSVASIETIISKLPNSTLKSTIILPLRIWLSSTW